MTYTNPVDLYVGARLRERRYQSGETLERLAALMGVSAARLERFEAGLERIPAAMMVALCNALGVGPSFFFEVSSDVERVESPVCDQGRIALVSPSRRH